MISVVRICPECGAEIPADAPEGGCPCCLLKSGLNLLADEEQATSDVAAKQQISTCPTCGAALEETPGGGLGCLSCLLHAGIGSEEETLHDSMPDALEGGLRFGVYEIDCREDGRLYELGRGAMGVTYRATDTSLQREVALKIIKTDIAERSADARERFMREARAAASLRHENIAIVYQFGMSVETGQYFYAMELIEGETLEERVRRAGPLDARTTVDIAQQVTSALAAAEKHGLVHRDLKPANLMLVNANDPELTWSNQARSKRSRLRALRRRGIPVVKIIDFGLAKAFHTATDPRSLTHDRFVGTPAFASPEQFEHSALDVRSDIYSLGETLWFALTGKTPFAGRTLSEIHRAQQSNELPSEQLKAVHVPHRLKSLLESMLAFEPASRPGTSELAARLQRCSPEARSVRRTRATLALATAIVFGMSTLFLAYQSRVENAALNPASEKSIAVLPFENRSDDKANAYFADGIQDEILTRLSNIADLKVISRSSTQHYKSAPENLREIAKQLGVAHVLEGSVQKSGDAVRVNVQLIKAATDSHLWADTYDRKLIDIFSVESEVAKAIADQLRAKLTGQEEQILLAKPTDNPDAYDAYLRGLAYTLKTTSSPANALAAQKYLREAVRLDPKFALAWALLSYADAIGYTVQSLQPTVALREEARQAAETALALQPNLGEAVVAKGYYHYACLKDYDTAVRYFERARPLLPNSSRIPESLAYLERRRGQWARSESYFNEAERLDPRNVNMLNEHAASYIMLRRFPDALLKLDQVLNIIPDDVDTLAIKAGVAQAEGDLPRAAALLASLHPGADSSYVLETQVYQEILERRPPQITTRLKKILTKPDPALGYLNGELRFWLGWAQDVAGDHAAAQASWSQARSELESFLKEQSDNYLLIGYLALTNMTLGDKAAALTLSERAMAALPMEKDAVTGLIPIEFLARVAAQMGEPDRAIAALQKLLSTPYAGAFPPGPLTPALLRLDPMFDALRNDPRFQKLCEEKQP
jgi:serine/threonine protein kinase/Tfp pilus assembly protein PilF